MSVTNARRFIESVRSDISLQDEIKSLQSHETNGQVSAVATLAAEYGVAFDAEHFTEAATAHVADRYADEVDIDDADLEHITLGYRDMANATNCNYGCSCTEETFQQGCR